MFIKQASFEIEKASEEALAKKARKNQAEAKAAAGNIDFEIWRQEKKDTVEYALVSKWEKQADFTNWISRDDHKEEHKQMRTKEKETGEPAHQMKKTMRSYELIN